MNIAHRDHQHVTVLTLKGEMVRESAERFRRAALDRVDAGIRDFVIDGQALEAVDSPALEALLWLQEQANERLGQVRLAACPPFLTDVLTMTRLNHRLQHLPTVDQAVQSLE